MKKRKGKNNTKNRRRVFQASKSKKSFNEPSINHNDDFDSSFWGNMNNRFSHFASSFRGGR